MAKQIDLFGPTKIIDYSSINYIVGEFNDFAHGYILSWPDWVSGIVYLHGPSGSGKTHLAHMWQKKSNAKFINGKYIKHLSVHNDSHRCLIIDDIEHILKNRKIYGAFVDFYNAVFYEGKFLLVTSSYHPNEMINRFNLIPDVGSRLRGMLHVTIDEPDDCISTQLICKKFIDYQVDCSPRVILYIARMLPRSFAAIDNFVKNIVHYAISNKRRIDCRMVNTILKG